MTAMTIERDVMVPARDGVPLAAGGVLLWIVVPLVAAGSGAMA